MTVTSAPRPTSPPTRPAYHPASVVAATLSPASLVPGGAVAARVQTRGNVDRVEVYLGSPLPNAPAPLTFTLGEDSPGTWSASGTAPTQPGDYHYSVGIFTGGRRLLIDNDAWNVKVMGSAPPAVGGVQPLPADIPLAPPFSYGNAVAAVFNAGGRMVNGAEVTSTTRPDVAPGVVSQWYSVHLPRAGWVVDQSTVPAAGATAFSIVATQSSASGTRVCIVQYGGYTVHIFYGTA